MLAACCLEHCNLFEPINILWQYLFSLPAKLIKSAWTRVGYLSTTSFSILNSIIPNSFAITYILAIAERTKLLSAKMVESISNSPARRSRHS
jgi:hypothetical protein